MTLRKSAERGHANHGWLDSYHSFSFNRYYDPAHMQYSVLRVINEDVIAPAAGFGMHPHRDMEIITYMLSGELRHTDDIGNTAVIRAGDVQRMSAGTGVMHSEVNASDSVPVHLLQIWLLPERKGIAPGYEDMHFPKAGKLNQWRLIASRQHRPDSLLVHQDVTLRQRCWNRATRSIMCWATGAAPTCKWRAARLCSTASGCWRVMQPGWMCRNGWR